MEFHVLRLLLTVFCCYAGTCTAGRTLPPRITPLLEDFVKLPQPSQLLTNASRTFRLLCQGQKPVNWTFPTPSIINFPPSIKNLSAWEQPTNIDYPYAAHIEVEDSMYDDTGYYYCSYDTSELEEDETSSVYVFVQDNTHLLVGDNGLNMYHPRQYTTVVIDCRPTSPDVQVSLWREDIRIDGGVKPTEVHGMTVTFDPTVGFTLENVDFNNVDPQYECKGVKGDIEDVFTFGLSVLAHTDSMAKPRISGEGIVAVGGELILNCTVMVDLSIYFSMNWTIPDPTAIKERRVQIYNSTLGFVEDPNGIRKKIGSCALKILRASKSDLGNYTCIARDHATNQNTDTKFVKVISESEKFINLTTETQTLTTPAGVSTIQWVVEVSAHPMVVNMTWFSPQNRTIPMSTKYSFNWTQTSAVLRIHDVDIQDTGTYRLLAMSDVKETTLNLKLVVKDKPAVIMLPEPEIYYNFGTSYEIDCRVIGFPKPDIEWGFQTCDNPPICDSTTIPVSRSKSREYYKDGAYISTLNWKASRSGYLTCRANNSEGMGEDVRDIWVTDVKNGFFLDGKNQAVAAVEEDKITMNCGASKYNNSNVQWFLNSTDRLIADFKLANVILSTKTTQFSYQSIVTITNITNKNNGLYHCSASSLTDVGSTDHVLITVKAKQKPQISSKEMDGSTIEVKTEDKAEWTCVPMGVPLPNIRWFKNDQLLNPSKNNSLYELSFDNRTLFIKYQSEKTSGKYTCEAWNRAGVARKHRTLKFIGGGLSVGITVVLVFFVLLVVALIAILVIKMRREQILRNDLKIAGLAHFEEGDLACINPELPIDDQAELLPYDRKWEFPRDSLKLGKQLGAGAFGIVMKAEATGINEGEATTTVAVKMVKRNAEYTYIKALASELKIMVHLGKHLNVVNLLGACTKNLTKRELLVIVEYCRFGNLHNYLLRHRADFIDQVDPKTGQIDPTLGADILSRHESINSKSRLKYAALSFSSNSGEMSVDYRAPVSGSSSGENPDMASICMTPTGDEGCMLSNNSIQPEWRSNYRGDYKGNVRPICTRDLLCWAFQVARGMEYLAGRKVLHGDLAARNILLADNNVVKICDFGLAKSMYKTDNYRKKGDGPLPVKWMAIESIRDRVFSTQSDVWSFGIVLWEFFSLARTPYPGMEADEKLYTKLVEGYRMDKPEFATKELYDTIEQCWLSQPNDRPTFPELSEQLGYMLEDTVRMHYIDLNGPYMDMNTIWKAGNQSDYLAMMSAPTYGNLVSPGDEEGEEPHQYVNNPIAIGDPSSPGGEGSGYMCMKSPDSVIFSPRANSPSMFNFAPDPRKLRNDSRGASGTEELRPMLLSGGRGGSDSEGDYKSPNTPQLVNNLNKDTKTNVFSKDSEDKTKQNIAPSFSNPSYQTMGPIINATPDNYVNMPQQKLGSALKSDVKNTDIPVSFSNPNYVSMGKVEGLDESSNHDLKGSDTERYVNLPSHGHNLSNASSGFQSDLGESPYVN